MCPYLCNSDTQAPLLARPPAPEDLRDEGVRVGAALRQDLERMEVDRDISALARLA